MKTTVVVLSTLAIMMTGCMNGSPTPSKEGKKPTVFVKSNTAEKFKDLTHANALWNGISPRFVTDKKYMRCDMTEEAMAVFARRGFELVPSAKGADYTFETTLLSCGNGFKQYAGNKKELPIKERELYKDFIDWIEDDENVPSDAKEIAELIAQEKEEGFERFYEERYIYKFGRNPFGKGIWQINNNQDKKYLISTDGEVLPAKYYKITKEDQAALETLNKKFKAVAGIHNGGGDMIVHGAHTGGAIGAAGIGFGILMSFNAVAVPTPVNNFKIINNKTGKSWEIDMNFSIAPQSWESNIKKPMDDWVIDEIPWSDID